MGCGNDVFEAHDIALSFDGKRLVPHVNIDIKKGERVFLIGANGCGKTSLFKILRGSTLRISEVSSTAPAFSTDISIRHRRV